MKKFLKVVAGGVALASAVAAYRFKKDYDSQKLSELALSHARDFVKQTDSVTGSWIGVRPVWSDNFQAYVYMGGVTTDQDTYDFVAAQEDARLLSIQKQVR